MPRLFLLLVTLHLAPGPLGGAGFRAALEGPSTRVIIHHEVPDLLSPEKLRSILAFDTVRWADGTPITLVVFDDADEVHVRFCREHLGVHPYALRHAWRRRAAVGARPPLIVRDPATMMRRVALRPGAIGYLDTATLNRVGVDTLEKGDTPE